MAELRGWGVLGRQQAWVWRRPSGVRGVGWVEKGRQGGVCGVWRLRARACAYLARACMRCACSVNVCVRDVCAGEELLESPFPEESWGRPRPWPLPLCRVGLRPGDLGARLTPRLSSPPLQGAHCPEPRRLPPTSWVWVPRPLGRADSAPVRSGREAGRWRSALDTLPPARPQDARPGRAASCAPVLD